MKNPKLTKPELLHKLNNHPATGKLNAGDVASGAQVGRIWDWLLDGLAAIVLKGEGFRLGNLGHFEVVEVAEKTRTSRNPSTSENFTLTISAHRTLRFRVAKAFRRMM